MAHRNNRAIVLAAAAGVLGAAGSVLAGEITFGGRTWTHKDTAGTYGVVGDSGTMTGSFGADAAMGTPVSLAVGDTITYDYQLSANGDTYVGDALGEFRGGTLDAGLNGFLISGRVGNGGGYGRYLIGQIAGFSTDKTYAGGGTEATPGLRFRWWFPTANTYQVTVSNIGSGSPLFGFNGITNGDPVTAISFFRQGLFDSQQTVTMSNFTQAPAGPAGALVFGFEGGVTAQGFKNLQAAGSVTSWTSTSAAIDIGNGFNLLSATQGSDRVVVDPYSARDNFGHAQHKTMLLRSPAFMLDGSGSLQVDMLGGEKYGENKNLADLAQADPQHAGELGSLQRNASFDYAGAGETNDGKHIQGFALRDALTGEYVLFGSGSATADGKQRASDPYDRGHWNTAMFTAAELAPFANNGRRYQVDFIDSFGETSWGHIGFDNLRVPGVLSALAAGDTNGDGAINGGDVQVAFGNFTGPRGASPVAKPDGKARIDGDLDDNGDVDGGDIQQIYGNFGNAAALAAASAGVGALTGEAQLSYDPATGNVTLDASLAPGAKITSFRLLSSGGDLNAPGVVVFPSANLFTTDQTTEIFWSDPNGVGFAGLHNLGAILDSGLTLAQIQAALSGATYTGQLGTGVRDLDITVVPEPGGLMVLAAGALAMARRRVRRLAR